MLGNKFFPKFFHVIAHVKFIKRGNKFLIVLIASLSSSRITLGIEFQMFLNVP
jgi:hypothetical protein